MLRIGTNVQVPIDTRAGSFIMTLRDTYGNVLQLFHVTVQNTITLTAVNMTVHGYKDTPWWNGFSLCYSDYLAIY